MKLIKGIANRIRYFLNKNNWSVYKLSRVSGLTPNCIQIILKEESQNIKLTTLILIAHAFGVTISEFLNIEDLNFDNLNIDY